jgi:RHS repeat-associated protein
MGNILLIGSGSLSRVFTYDAENRQMTAVINAAGSNSYVYDGDGRRVQATTASGTTTFVYDAQGHLAQEYSTATPTDTGTSYLFGDQLGSTRLITDASGGIKKRFHYLPFGEEILSSFAGGRTDAMGYNDGGTVGLTDKQRLKFTSKERDAETGLDYFGARYFSSAQGRFTSAHNGAGPFDFIDPQSLNRYTYGFNRPTTVIDPDGHWPFFAHDALNGFALRLSSWAMGRVQRYNRNADFGADSTGVSYRDPYYAYRHGMCDAKAGRCAETISDFIMTGLNMAKAQKKGEISPTLRSSGSFLRSTILRI